MNKVNANGNGVRSTTSDQTRQIYANLDILESNVPTKVKGTMQSTMIDLVQQLRAEASKIDAVDDCLTVPRGTERTPGADRDTPAL